MRVIAGSLGGRMFDAPGGHKTHPMGDKIRGALFGTLGDISGLTVLDAFGGSGAVTLEAISRGAHRATVIENDKHAFQIIKDNVTKLDILRKVELIHANALSWSKRHKEAGFDIVILDPPFDKVLHSTLIFLTRHVSEAGTLVLSLPNDGYSLNLPAFEQVKHKTYGDASLVFYRRIP